MRNFIEVDESELGRPHLRRHNPVLTAAMIGTVGTQNGVPLLTLDIIRQDLYSFYQVAVATLLKKQVIFAQGKNGNYTPLGGTAFQLTALHTNLLVGAAGGLANPQRFMARGICRYVREDVNPIDLFNWNFSTYVEFDVGDSEKPYMQAQLIEIPQPSALQIQSQPANADTATYATTGWPVSHNFKDLLAEGLLDPDTGQPITDCGITLDQGQYFALVLDPTLTSGAFPVYQTLGGSTAGGTGIQAYFHLIGVLGRSAQ